MRRLRFGASIYFVTDKNIYDALNEHKVDSATVTRLFQRRNTITCPSAPREDLAAHFARLNHDYFDHQEIANRLGVVPRRERTSSIDLVGIGEIEPLLTAVRSVADKLQAYGDVVNTVRKNSSVFLNVQYSHVDYRRSEFNQVQVRDGVIEFTKEADAYVVRSTKNAHIDDIRDEIIKKLSESVDIEQRNVSLFAHSDSRVRSGFFYDLFSALPGLKLVDVTDVYVYKGSVEEELEDSFVERVSLKGKGVTRSEFLSSLDGDGYYTYRVVWRAKEELGRGDEFDIEVVFADPVDCTGFAFILLGVREAVGGAVSKKRRMPTTIETLRIAKAVESRARELIAKLNQSVGADDG